MQRHGTDGMIRSIALRRLPALMLAMLAIWRLLVRGQAVQASGAILAIYGILCHAGDAGQRDPLHPPSDCDSCLLCQAVPGDHGAMIAGNCRSISAVPPLASLSLALQVAEAGFGQDAARARAPPASA